MSTTLTAQEATRLEHLERTIEHHLEGFRQVGEALRLIRDERLYRREHGTFEDYCRERWGFSRVHAWRLIAAADVAEDLLPAGNIEPQSERQARPLAALPDAESRREAWAEAVAESGGQPTSAAVQAIVDRALGKLPAEQQRAIIAAEEQTVAARDEVRQREERSEGQRDLRSRMREYHRKLRKLAGKCDGDREQYLDALDTLDACLEAM